MGKQPSFLCMHQILLWIGQFYAAQLNLANIKQGINTSTNTVSLLVFANLQNRLQMKRKQAEVRKLTAS